ncbi:hypothetical protein GRF29_44g2698873 [Pseudopithomyces chartarum]|uniref:Uncharacterized protein n=1 Tax=Pseudopithomyces chartarum TaxID=1892770 RepID=A0AAN6RKC4_9PLEO|nr:hypothetical protein GRF29_44g2698873 [Pseudopithomyces chartarum]
MSGPPLAKSRPKKDLMDRLHLSGPEGDYIYDLLYAEATAGRDRLSVDYNALTDYSRNNRVQAPYRWDDLQETYRHRERMNIVARARPETQRFYQMGQYGTTVVDNWVADWFLWHSFRFRDNRTTAANHANSKQASASSTSATTNGHYWKTILHDTTKPR